MADDEQTRTLDRQLHGLPSHDDDKNNSLVTYATTTDVFWVLTSSLAAVIAGALNPLLTVLYNPFFLPQPLPLARVSAEMLADIATAGHLWTVCRCIHGPKPRQR